MSPITILLRFIIGIVLAAVLLIPLGLSLTLSVIFLLTIGTAAAMWGDTFIMRFMSLMRYLR